ncbi:hypothetical protein PtB15_7B664 [Puccinia triticina]|nr:hypothetical protein PtB15_7B664 [Puccinia triticina]
MKLFDGWDHVGAKTWVANPARSTSGTPGPGLPGSDHSRGSLTRRPSISRLNSVREHQSIDDHSRKLKELRLAELTRQLELTELQRNHPHPQAYASVPPPPTSRPMTPISCKLSGVPGGPPLSNQDLVWEEKLREANELNARIENLRLAGMPPDQLPSPVLLPSRPPSRARTDKPHPNCVPPRDYPIPPLSSFAPEAVLRRQLSKKSLNSLSSSHHTQSPAPPVSQPHQNRDRAASASQASHYQALKEAEDVICKLRKSHDELLEKVRILENQLDLKEAENQDLTTRNNRLETYLADEQKAKEGIQRENERAMNQLRSLSRSQPPHHSQREDPSARLYTQAEPPQSLHERFYRSQSGTVPPDQNMSKARAELLQREENLKRQYSYKSGSLTPELARPGSVLGHNLPGHPMPPPMGNASQQHHHHHNLYESSQPDGYHFPPTSEPPHSHFYPEEHRQRPLDPGHPQMAYPSYLHQQGPPLFPHQFPRPNPPPKPLNPIDEPPSGSNGFHTPNHSNPAYNRLY